MADVLVFGLNRAVKATRHARAPRPRQAPKLSVRLPGLQAAIERSGGKLNGKVFAELFGYWHNWLSRTQNWDTQPSLEQAVIMCARAGISLCEALGFKCNCPPIPREYAEDRHRRERKRRKNDWKGDW